ncbi:MAG: GNAT family N-acetyltransferase [Candidatus Cloacimonadota bacterium]|nr:MAG: GNAT family N-acetyltransferase [Candidatus Cloacimonadota bacterium]
MKIKSLGYRTDFIFNRFDGSIEEKENYIVVKTKSNPNYFWGNLLLYKNPPQIGDLEKWKLDFHKEFTNPNIYHITLAWDSINGDVTCPKEFILDGFELDNSVVLVATEVIKPKKLNIDIEVRLIKTEEEFKKVIKIQTRCGGSHLSRDSWESFYNVQMKQYKKMISQGLGNWFGAYLNKDLVGSLGIFNDKEVGRFQIVSTDPKHQRKGICSTLVYKSAIFAFEKMKLTTLVMVADEEYHAAKIYESVGFKANQRQIGLCWWDKSRK